MFRILYRKKIDAIRGVEYVEKSESDKLFYWKKLGEYAKTISKISVEGYGSKFNNNSESFFDRQTSFLDFIDYNITSLSQAEDPFTTNNYVTLEQHELLRKVLGKLRERLQAGQFTSGLVHGDLSLRNILVDETGKAYLLDWECACAGIVPHKEINTVLQHVFNFDNQSDCFKAFVDGFGISENEFKNLESDLYAMLLLSCADMVRWAIDRCPEAIEDEVSSLQKALKLYSQVNTER